MEDRDGGIAADQPERLFNEFQLAAYLGVARDTLSVWRRKGGGPAYIQISKAVVRYRLSDVRAWLEQKKVEVGLSIKRGGAEKGD